MTSLCILQIWQLFFLWKEERRAVAWLCLRSLNTCKHEIFVSFHFSWWNTSWNFSFINNDILDYFYRVVMEVVCCNTSGGLWITQKIGFCFCEQSLCIAVLCFFFFVVLSVTVTDISLLRQCTVLLKHYRQVGVCVSHKKTGACVACIYTALCIAYLYAQYGIQQVYYLGQRSCFCTVNQA